MTESVNLRDVILGAILALLIVVVVKLSSITPCPCAGKCGDCCVPAANSKSKSGELGKGDLGAVVP